MSDFYLAFRYERDSDRGWQVYEQDRSFLGYATQQGLPGRCWYAHTPELRPLRSDYPSREAAALALREALAVPA